MKKKIYVKLFIKNKLSLYGEQNRQSEINEISDVCYDKKIYDLVYLFINLPGLFKTKATLYNKIRLQD